MEVVHIILQNFAQHLAAQNASASTIKNYLADINLFFRYLKNHDQPVSLLTLPRQLSGYHQYLISNFPSSTVKRRLSSLNKFTSFIIPVTTTIAKPRFNYHLALFILLIISLSIIGGFVASLVLP